MSNRPKYEGKEQKLVLAFDVGTTFSGISYAILAPGAIPEIKSVTRFPHQAHTGGDAKIPTAIYYDNEGQARAFGAETAIESTQEQAREEQWHKSEWFKLHFRPANLPSSMISMDDRPLPPNKTATQVLSDFLRYLLVCVREFISEAHPNGAALWNSAKDTMEFVLTHPNGWGGPHQARMRQAAIAAELIPDNNGGHSRISFVTEGEASLHYCIQHGLSEYVKTAGRDAGIVIIDAGGGTIDISAYAAIGESDFEEICEPQCHFAGSTLVTQHAEEYISSKLKGSRFEEDVDQIGITFDKKTKLNFRKPDSDYYIKFGSIRDSDAKFDVVRGQLRIPGKVIAEFFDPSIQSIIQAVSDQLKPKQGTAIFLVGGFAASDFLFSRLNDFLQPLGVTFCRPDSHTNKAVSEGAVSYSIDHVVSRRVAPITYGMRSTIIYDPSNIEHRRRQKFVKTAPSGQRDLHEYFTPILHKGTSVSEDRLFAYTFHRELSANEIHVLGNFEQIIVGYYGALANPMWMDIEPESYKVVCTIGADMREIIQSSKPIPGPNGLYYRITYGILLSFGTTELKAQIAWKEEEVEKRSPARVIYT